MNPYFLNYGTGKAFGAPIELIEVDPAAANLVSVSFNEDWLAYVVGACKVLTLPSTWKTDDQSAIQLVVHRANDLLELLSSAIVAIIPVNWQLAISYLSGSGSWELAYGNNLNQGILEYFGDFDVNPELETVDVIVSGYPAGAFGVLVGGKFTDFEVHSEPEGSVAVYAVTKTDCLGNVTIDTGITPYILHNVTMKSFEVTAGHDVSVRAVIVGKWQCGPV